MDGDSLLNRGVCFPLPISGCVTTRYFILRMELSLESTSLLYFAVAMGYYSQKLLRLEVETLVHRAVGFAYILDSFLQLKRLWKVVTLPPQILSIKMRSLFCGTP